MHSCVGNSEIWPKLGGRTLLEGGVILASVRGMLKF